MVNQKLSTALLQNVENTIEPGNGDFEYIRFILAHFKKFLHNWLLNQHSKQYCPVLITQ